MLESKCLVLGPQSERPSLCAGNNSRASQRKAKVSLFRGICIPQAECRLSQKVRAALGCGVIGFFGLNHFIRDPVRAMFLLFQGRVGSWQELGLCPLFGLLWLSWYCHRVRGCDFKCYNEGVCAQSSLTLCDHMNCSLPGSYIEGIFQARILERVAISSFGGCSQPRN